MTTPVIAVAIFLFVCSTVSLLLALNRVLEAYSALQSSTHEQATYLTELLITDYHDFKQSQVELKRAGTPSAPPAPPTYVPFSGITE